MYFMQKFESQYPATPLLTKLRLYDTHVFLITGVDNFESLLLESIFDMTKDSPTIFKV